MVVRVHMTMARGRGRWCVLPAIAYTSYASAGPPIPIGHTSSASKYADFLEAKY